MAENKVDLIVIGAGPGGYVAAIRAAQLGMTVLCVEKRSTLGGTCLNVGCIPSKALLSTSHKYAEAQNHFSDLGINVGKVSLDLAKMMENKDKVVGQLTSGVDYLFKKNKVTHIVGTARLLSSSVVAITTDKGEETWKTHKILIATGSESTTLPGIEVDEKTVVSSTGALSLKAVPKHMIVVGGGYIGLEMGSVWQRLGAKVTVIEYMDRLVPQMDRELSAALQKSLTKQGIEFKLSTKVSGIKGGQVTVESSDGKKEELSADVVLMATGRKPYTKGLRPGRNRRCSKQARLHCGERTL